MYVGTHTTSTLNYHFETGLIVNKKIFKCVQKINLVPQKVN